MCSPGASNSRSAKHLRRKWDQRFESAFLQRRVCKLSVPAIVAEGIGPLSQLQQRAKVGSDSASIYPAVENMLLAARALGLGSTLTMLKWEETFLPSRVATGAACPGHNRTIVARSLPARTPGGKVRERLPGCGDRRYR
jgi:hypothetical protein